MVVKVSDIRTSRIGLIRYGKRLRQIKCDVLNCCYRRKCCCPIALLSKSNGTSGVNEISEIFGKANLTCGRFRNQAKLLAYLDHLGQAPILGFGGGWLR
jgi:hypothetical protein